MPFKDPIKQAEAKKRWYEKNKELTKKRALESKHRTRAWYREKKTQDQKRRENTNFLTKYQLLIIFKNYT